MILPLKVNDIEVTPKPNCPECHGRGVVGINALTKAKVVCRCVIKQLIKLKAGSPKK